MSVDIDAAVTYNRRQPIDRYAWQRLQMPLQIEPDGDPGAATARAAVLYQTAHGLGVDGKIGPQTRAALEADRAPWEAIDTVGLYWDLPARWTIERSRELAATLAELGVDHVQTMIDSSDQGPFESDWSLSQLESWQISLAANGVTHGITAWAIPRRDRLEPLKMAVSELVDASGAIRFGLDCEEHLRERHIRGYAGREDVALAIFEILDEARSCTTRAEVSSYPALLGKVDTWWAELMAAADICCLQGYVTEAETDGQWWHPQGPGRGVWRDILRYRQRVPPGGIGRGKAPPPLVASCGMWDRHDDPGGGGPEGAILLDIEQAVRLGCREVRGWSAKHLLGGHMPRARRAYNRRALKELARLRAGRACA